MIQKPPRILKLCFERKSMSPRKLSRFSLPWFPLSRFLPKLWWTLPRLEPSPEDSPGPLLEAQLQGTQLYCSLSRFSLPSSRFSLPSSRFSLPWFPLSRFLLKLWWTIPRLDPSPEDSPDPPLEAQVHLLLKSVEKHLFKLRRTLTEIKNFEEMLTGRRVSGLTIICFSIYKQIFFQVVVCHHYVQLRNSSRDTVWKTSPVVRARMLFTAGGMKLAEDQAIFNQA